MRAIEIGLELEEDELMASSFLLIDELIQPKALGHHKGKQ
jgi:hypothetical protein